MKVRVSGVSISCLFRKGEGEAIAFIHGLGGSREDFLEAFRREDFRQFTLLSADLVGFGDSDKPVGFSYLMKEQAAILGKVIDRFGVGRFHLVAHSMGGIVGIELCEIMPNRVYSFINAEGNLTAEDCTITRRIAQMTEEEFVREGFDQIKREFREEFERRGDQGGMAYLRTLSKATAESMYKSSLSTVQESDFGSLLDRFISLPFFKCYIYGEKNRGVFPSEKLLRQKRIPIFYISKSGHTMIEENPDEFYDCVSGIVRRGQ